MTPSYRSPAIPSKRAAPFYAAYFGVLGVVLPFLGPFLESRGVDAVGIGLITALFSLAKIIYTPAVGALVDRGVWFRGLLSLHMVLAVVVALVVHWLHSSWALGCAFFIIGIGYGTVLPLIEAAILERLPESGYGLMRMWGSIGFVAASAAAAATVDAFGLSALPLLMMVSLGVVAISCLPFERAARPDQSQLTGRIPGLVWVLLGLLTLNQVSHGPYYAFFSVHLQAEGVGTAAISALWSLGVVAELGAFFAGARLETTFGLRRLLGLALLLSPLRWLLLAIPPTTATLVAAQLGHAVTFAAVHLAGVQLVQASVPAGAIRKAQALYSGFCFGLGVVLGTALAGPVYAISGSRGSFLSAAGLSAAIFIAWLPLSRSLSERHA
jgi:PPP family 3-phenylpropionic acid transporter